MDILTFEWRDFYKNVVLFGILILMYDVPRKINYMYSRTKKEDGFISVAAISRFGHPVPLHFVVCFAVLLLFIFSSVSPYMLAEV